MSSGNLQDIYDAGVRRFEEVEQEIKCGMSNHALISGEFCDRCESSFLRRMEGGLAEEEKALAEYLQYAQAGIAAAVKSELEETDHFLSRLKDNLELSQRFLLQEIVQFQEFLSQHFENQRSCHSELLKRDAQRLVLELKLQTGVKEDEIRLKASESQCRLGDDIAAGIAETLVQCSHSSEELYDVVVSGVADFDAAFSASRQSLAAQQAETIDKLKDLDQEFCSLISAVSKQCLIDIEGSTAGAKLALNDTYAKALAEALESQASLAVQQREDFEKSLKFSREGLSGSLLDLKTTAMVVLEETKRQVRDTDSSSAQRTLDIFDTFALAVTDKIGAARAQQEALASESHSLMEKIMSDLGVITQEYENRFSDLSRQCLEKLSSICVDAEMAISSTHDHCAADFRNVASAAQQDVAQKTASLLERIEKISQAAVSNIKTAAAEGEKGGEQA